VHIKYICKSQIGTYEALQACVKHWNSELNVYTSCVICTRDVPYTELSKHDGNMLFNIVRHVLACQLECLKQS
jgi:hypothetical protein